MSKKIILFGAGKTGQRIKRELVYLEVVAFLDNDPTLIGKSIEGIAVYEPKKEILCQIAYDYIMVASVFGFNEIRNQLLDMGVPSNVIVPYPKANRSDYFYYNLKSLFVKNSIIGNVAELGVFKGDTAEVLNRVFNDRILHLFDTFEGFDARDVAVEGDNNSKEGQFGDTSVEYVMKRMDHPEKVVIHKGYFPDTAKDLNDSFCMIRIDMDLYNPTAAALSVFDGMISHGGVILVDDYFNEGYTGVKKAVDEYINNNEGRLSLVPKGDRFGIVITGY